MWLDPWADGINTRAKTRVESQFDLPATLNFAIRAIENRETWYAKE